MNAKHSIFVMTLFLLLSITKAASCFNFSVGLSYNEQNNGHLKGSIGCNVPVETNSGIFKPQIKVSYIDSPGLLGPNGHIKAELDLQVPQNSNPSYLIAKNLVLGEINEQIDYNPIKNEYIKYYNNKRRKQLEDQQKQQAAESFMQQEEYFLMLKQYMAQDNVANFHKKTTNDSEKSLWDEIKAQHDK